MEQTLIEHVCEQVMDNGDLPENLAQLNLQLHSQSCCGWRLSQNLVHFKQTFCLGSVVRKWVARVYVHKHVKGDQKTTERKEDH